MATPELNLSGFYKELSPEEAEQNALDLRARFKTTLKKLPEFLEGSADAIMDLTHIVNFHFRDSDYTVKYSKHGVIEEFSITREESRGEGEKMLREELSIIIGIYQIIQYGNNFNQENGRGPHIIPHDINNQAALVGANKMLAQLQLELTVSTPSANP